MKILVLTLDGYNGWEPSQEEVIELSEFTPESISSFLSEEDETITLNDIGNHINIQTNSISVFYDEGGYIFIKLN